MITLLIGNNAIGKTRYLQELLSNHNPNDVLTNMYSKVYILKEDYNEERLNVLKDILMTDDILLDHKILYPNNPYFIPSNAFMELMTLLCKNRNIVFLDEPTKELQFHEKAKLVKFLARTAETYKTVYITTHYTGMLNLIDREVYTIEKVDKKVLLKKVNEEDEYGVIDKI